MPKCLQCGKHFDFDPTKPEKQYCKVSCRNKWHKLNRKRKRQNAQYYYQAVDEHKPGKTWKAVHYVAAFWRSYEITVESPEFNPMH